MSKHLIYAGNWKMQLAYAQAIAYAYNNKDKFIQLAQQENTEIILCPSFDALAHITDLFKNSPVNTGAQNCAAYKKGAYTGEVSAQSIQELGASFCIVGHSERRHYFGETNEIIAQKVNLLLEQDTIPIACIGETKQEYVDKKTYQVLKKQLNSLFNVTKNSTTYIAYEPIWAIGTGIAAEENYLQEVFSWLHKICEEQCATATFSLLYGGSVDEKNAAMLKQISYLDGFLIGGASLDFQKFQNIVLS